MNIFRFIADFLHLLSFIIIVYKLMRDKNCKGVSCKTQEIYLIVFLTRYLDLFMYFVSFYNTIMKILFIGVTLFIIYVMRLKKPTCNTYNRATEDDFPHLYLIPFALVLTLLIHSEWDWWELLWCFSLWLESVAILNWVYRYKYEGYLSWVSILSGTLQVLLYADFFYLYLKNLKKRFSSDLPISAPDKVPEKPI